MIATFLFRNSFGTSDGGRDSQSIAFFATPGQGGTILSQAAWLPILATLGASPWFDGRLRISGAASVFDANGKLVDEKIREQLKKFVEGFAAYCGSAT